MNSRVIYDSHSLKIEVDIWELNFLESRDLSFVYMLKSYPNCPGQRSLVAKTQTYLELLKRILQQLLALNKV